MHETHICSDCHGTMIPTRRNWCGPDEDIPVCNRCLDADEIPEMPNIFAQNRQHHPTSIERAAEKIAETADDLTQIWEHGK